MTGKDLVFPNVVALGTFVKPKLKFCGKRTPKEKVLVVVVGVSMEIPFAMLCKVGVTQLLQTKEGK